MIEFFSEQMDYIYFFYGLAFLMLGGACFVLLRKKDGLLPWGWLGLFGVTHAAHEWTDILEIGLGNSYLLETARVVLALASFVFLVEFARAGLLRLRGRGPGRWIFIPLFLLTVLGSLEGWDGIHAASRYTFGLLGCGGSAYVMLLASREADPRSRRWLIGGSWSLFCYAVASTVGVPTAHFFPASLINETVFSRFTGIPIQLVRGIAATMTAVFLWTYSQTRPAGDSLLFRSRRRQILAPVIILLLIIGGGWLLTEFMGNQAREEELADGNLFAGIVAHHYEAEVEDARRAVAAKATLPAVVRAAATGQKKDLEKAGLQLNQCIYSRDACDEVFFLLDRRGKVILDCLRSPGIPDRRDFGSTPLFLQAAEGKTGRFLAVSADSGARSLYVSSPVKDSSGRILGVVAVRRDVLGLEEAFKEHPYCFMVDPRGIAFLSSRDDLRLRVLWDSPGSRRGIPAASGRAGLLSVVPPLSQEAVDGKYATFNKVSMLVNKRSIYDEGWSVVLLSTTSHIKAYRLFSIFATFVFFGMTFAFFGVLYLGRDASEQIALSERRYRSLVQGSPNGVILFDREGRCHTINKAGLELLGCQEREIIGRSLEEYCSAESAGGIGEALKQVMQGKRCSLEIQGRGQDGKRPIWSAVFNPFYDPDGEIRNFVGILIDTTAQKQAELKLKASEQRFRSYFELSLIGVAITSPDNELIEFNDKLSDILGYSRAELEWKTLAEVTHPEDLSAEAHELTRVMAGESEAYSLEKRFIRKDGSMVFTNFSSRCVRRSEGAADYFVVLVEDITDRKFAEKALAGALDEMELKVRERTAELSEINRRLVKEIDERRQVAAALAASEERFHSLFNLASDCIFLLEPREGGEAVIVDTNIAACRMHGYDREELVGKPISFLNEKGSEAFSKGYVRRLTEGETVTFEIRHTRKDGSVFPLEVSAQMIHIGGKPYVLGIDRDISERKRAEEKIQQALIRLADEKAKSETIVSALADGVSIQSTDFRVLYQNEVHKNMVGDHAGEICYRSYAGSESVCEGCPVALSFSDGRVHMVEKSNVIDGKMRHVEIKASPLRDSSGKIIAGIELVRDITERRKAEESLRLFSEAMEEAMDGIQIIDLKGHIVYSNGAVEEIYGFPVEELRGIPVGNLNADPEIAGTVILPAIRSTGRWSGEIMVVHKSGRTFPIWLSTSLVKDRTGKAIAMIGIIRDMTERKRIEEELRRHREHLVEMVEERTTELRTAVQLLTQEISFRKNTEATLKESESRFRTLSQEFNTLLDAIPDTLLLLSPERTVLWANRAAVSSFGREIKDMIGKHCYTLWHDNPISCEECHVMKSFQSGATESSKRTTVNGMVLDSRAFPIKDENGKVTSVIVIVSDITEKTALQAEAMRASHLASLGELAAGVAHEINNPINGIINYAQLLSNKMDAGSREFDISRRIIKEGDRIAGIVKSLLSFARERKEELTRVDLQTTLFEAVTLTEAQIRKDGIELIIDVPENLPGVSANAQQIQQVFLNIISNARYALNQKYAGTDPDKKLTIWAEEIREGGAGYIRLEFRDNGTGIPPQLMSKIMDPFFSTKPSGQGTGLGLSISHGIVKNHGGRLAIESREGEFTLVTIDLPFRRKNG